MLVRQDGREHVSILVGSVFAWVGASAWLWVAWVGVWVAACLVGCSSTSGGSRPPAIETTGPVSDKDNSGLAGVLLGPGDVFEVQVYGEPDLTATYRVSNDGTINFPLVGRISVSGVAAADASAFIEEALRRYIQKPNVSVYVKEFNSQKVYVLGQVRTPGTFRFEDGMNVIQAITLAGGFDTFADKNAAFVTRIIDGEKTRMKVSIEDIREGRATNFRLVPGDIVYVPDRLF